MQKIVDAAKTYEETLKAQQQLLQIRPVEPVFLLGDDPAPPAPPPQRQSAKSVAAAAQAFAERLRTRVHGLAA